MADQKVMRVHFQSPGNVFAGDIAQCPACRWKFVVLPGMPYQGGDYWDIQTQGPPPPGWEDERSHMTCPKCGRATSMDYYEELSHTGGIELTNWGRPEPEEKEATPDGPQKRSRKGVPRKRS